MAKLLSILRISLILSLFCMAAMPSNADQSIQIAAAASFTDVFTNQIIPAFAKKTHIQVLPTYGATGLLAKQLENGAPYEVFVSADSTTPQRLAKENILRVDSIKDFTVGVLVLWSPTFPVDVDGLESPLKSTKNPPNTSIANPATAPYGAATIEALTKAKLLDKIQPDIVQAENINQSLQFTLTGNTEMCFTAYSLVKGREGHLFIVPQNLYSPLIQSVGLSQNASDGAHQFEDFLLSKDGQKILESVGYHPIKGVKSH
jgi:molybdate transport system substrate-binding protein